MKNLKDVKRIVNTETGEILTPETMIFSILEGETIEVEYKTGFKFLINSGVQLEALKRLAFC
ncbi:hypothetical protein EOM09_06225 [bacterium]|nr:hypothetical protein [bacterium]